MTEVNQEIRMQLRTFILENYLFTDDQNKLDDSTSFLQTGILDSMGILELIHYLNEDLSIKVASDEMIPDNLDSINNLLEFVKRKGS